MGRRDPRRLPQLHRQILGGEAESGVDRLAAHEPAARGLIRAHIEAFGVAGQVKLLKRDATDLGPIERLKPADLVFADPPYGKGLGEKAVASALAGGWIAPGALIGASEAGSGTALEDQQVEGITRPELAIGLVAKRVAAAATSVLIEIVSQFLPPT